MFLAWFKIFEWLLNLVLVVESLGFKKARFKALQRKFLKRYWVIFKTRFRFLL